MVRAIELYRGFEDWIAERITPDEFTRAIEAEREEGTSLTQTEVMDGIQTVFEDLTQREIKRGVDEEYANKIKLYFQKVIKPSKLSLQSDLRSFDIENVQVSAEEGTQRDFKLGDLIDRNIDFREQRAEIARQRRSIVPILQNNVGKTQNELREILRRSGISEDLINSEERRIKEYSDVGELERIQVEADEVDQRKYDSVLKRINDARSIRDINNIKDALDELSNFQRRISATRFLEEKRREISKKPLKPEEKEQIDRLLMPAPPKVPDTLFKTRLARDKWKKWLADTKTGLPEDARKVQKRYLLYGADLSELEADLLLKYYDDRERRRLTRQQEGTTVEEE